jgi:hypothetical protein
MSSSSSISRCDDTTQLKADSNLYYLGYIPVQFIVLCFWTDRLLTTPPNDVLIERDVGLSVEAELAAAVCAIERQSLLNQLHCQLDDIVDSLSDLYIAEAMATGGDLLGFFHRLLSQRRAKHQKDVSIGCRMIVMKPSVDYDPDRYQVLQKLGAPIDCLYLSHVVQEIDTPTRRRHQCMHP